MQPAHPLIVEALGVLRVADGAWRDCSAAYVSRETSVFPASCGIKATAHRLRHYAGTGETRAWTSTSRRSVWPVATTGPPRSSTRFTCPGEHGFRDAEGSHMMIGATVRGVWVSVVPLDENEDADGDDLLEITLPGGLDDLDDFEVVEEGDVPPSLLGERPVGHGVVANLIGPPTFGCCLPTG